VADHLQKSRRQVLVRLESILGNACYNANIQNYGPGGIREAEGRSFRYPLLIRHGLLQSPDAVQLEPVEGLRHLSPSKVYE